MLYSQLIGLLGLVAIAACWALAVVLFRVTAISNVARRLAVLLVLEGLVLLTAGYPAFLMGLEIEGMGYFSDPVLNFLDAAIHHMGDAAMIALYPPFLAFVLGTRWTLPFRDSRARRALAVCAIAIGVTVAVTVDALATAVLYLLVTLTFAYALIVSVHAWRISEAGLARERAGLFALAFGIRDLGWGISYGIGFWLMWNQQMDEMTPLEWLSKTVYALGTLLAVPLIAYGILKAHLFDIDLKIRWTIKQSTLAAVFISLMFLLSEAAEQILSAELGSFAGLLAAAVVVFFLAPLQRFAERVATAAMPNTAPTPEYEIFRKMQVYEEAIMEANHEDGISDRERALLVRLRDSLGITVSDADAIELEVLKRRPVSA